MDLRQPNPAPWRAALAPFPNPDNLWEVIGASGIAVMETYDRKLAERVALWRSAEDVMMRRGWFSSRWNDGQFHADAEDCGNGGWSDVTGEPKDFRAWCHEQQFGDPFSAVVEADKWYAEHVEAEKDRK